MPTMMIQPPGKMVAEVPADGPNQRPVNIHLRFVLNVPRVARFSSLISGSCTQ